MQKLPIDLLIREAEQDCQSVFARLDAIEQTNTERVLKAFQTHAVAARHFAPTSGYGYDDVGRDTLEKIFADVFFADEAIVRPQLTSGTHTLSTCLFGLLLPGDALLSCAGHPYDTMQGVIGITGDDQTGTLLEMGVTYGSVPLRDGKLDLPGILAAMTPKTKVALFQRSRGYAWRDAISNQDLRQAIAAVKARHPHVYVMVDNCYGEFTTSEEPTLWGADVIAGSLIKNPGGGLAPTGGYIAGTAQAIRRIETRLTAPKIGRETGSYQGDYRSFYQGLFLAPHTVNQALKTAVLAARLAEKCGFESSPRYDAVRTDIIQALKLNTREGLTTFCKHIQYASPVDSFVTPEPWAMPGYEDEVIMAAGTFVSGASIELSADGPLRAPYAAYLQGGLTYQSGKLALRGTFEAMLALRD